MEMNGRCNDKGLFCNAFSKHARPTWLACDIIPQTGLKPGLQIRVDCAAYCTSYVCTGVKIYPQQAQVALDDCILYLLFPFFLCSCMHLGASIFSCCAGVCLLLGKGWGSAQEMNHGVWGVDSVGAVVVAKTGRHRLAPG